MNLLIVEDNRLQLAALAQIIQNNYPDSSIFTATSCESAIDVIRGKDFDIFMLDITLGDNPDGGLDVCSYIREQEQYSDTPVIFITDLTTPSLDIINRYHCSYYFPKPYDELDVITAVNSVLSRGTERTGIRLKDICGIYFRLLYDELICASVEGHHKHLFTTSGDYLVTNPVFDSMYESDDCPLVRCHKSWFFNPRYASSYDRLNSYIHMEGNADVIPVGRKYKTDIDTLLLERDLSR